MTRALSPDLSGIIGPLPYRMAFAGGWIDQPFLSRHNPSPPGSMVVVSIQPTCRFMDRCGMGTSSRRVAARLWPQGPPAATARGSDPAALVRTLYEAENAGKAEPSGSQDMAGLFYPGVSRLDYDFSVEGGYFPAHVESNTDAGVARWLERHIYVVPVGPRPPGYNPLGVKNLDPAWIARLGQSGRDCYEAIVARDAAALGRAMNECMRCWQAILPYTVRHPTISLDLMGLLACYQDRYAGAMYSGCGGGYLYVVSEEPVPGGFQVTVRL